MPNHQLECKIFFYCLPGCFITWLPVEEATLQESHPCWKTNRGVLKQDLMDWVGWVRCNGGRGGEGKGRRDWYCTLPSPADVGKKGVGGF